MNAMRMEAAAPPPNTYPRPILGTQGGHQGMTAAIRPTAPPVSQPMPTSTRVFGNWILERELGVGGFGCVKLWKNQTTGERLALKQCRAGKEMSEKNKQRWRAECEIMMQLDHPNVVKAVPVPPELNIPNGELPLLAMEYCAGGDLRRLILKPEHCCGLPEQTVRSIAKDIGGALEYLHTHKIVHRDLKPENIILRKEGEDRVIFKLIDLGYAKDMDKDSICQSFVGTMQYLAPELFTREQYTRTVDYWSFGTLLFECIAGFRPFLHSKTPVQWQTEICKKQDTDIHAFLDREGRIQFSSQLPKPNWLCKTSVDAFQQLLYLLLRWNPETRGGPLGDKGRPACFALLESIITIKVIHVLCVPTNEVFTYAITPEKKTLQEIMSFLEMETRIPVQEQEILLATGLTAEPAASPQQCLGEADDAISLVYLFRKKETTFPQKKRKQQNYPQKMATMMSEPTSLMNYEDRRKVWGQAVHFCGEVVRNYRRLMDAQRAAMLCLLRYNTNFTKLKTKMVNDFASLNTRVEFFNQMSDYDKQRFEEQAKTGVFSKRMHLSWSKMKEEVNMIDELQKKMRQLDQKCTSLSTRIMELQRSPYTRQQHELPLEKREQQAIELYDKLKRLQQDERKKPQDSLKMVECVVECIRERIRMTNDLYLHIGKVAECRVEVVLLCPSVEEMVNLIQAHVEKISQRQRQRQKDMWRLLDVAIKQGKSPSISRMPSTVRSMDGLSSMESNSTTASLRQGVVEKMTDASSALRGDNKQTRELLKLKMALVQKDQVAADQTDLDWNFVPGEKEETSPKTPDKTEQPSSRRKPKTLFDLGDSGQATDV